MGAQPIRVVVIGAGIAGLAATIAFARAGHAVTLVERDAAQPPPEPDQSFLEWERPGVPQRRLVHGFLPLARKVLRESVPDIVERLFAAGAHDVDLLEPLQKRGFEPGDEELFVLRCRRTVFEWVLRQVVDEEPLASVIAGDAAAGLVVDGGAGGRPAAVTGVRLRSGAIVPGKVTIDAAGRQSQVPRWLQAAGSPPPKEEVTECNLVYYTRFYERPDAGFPVAVQANLGYLYATAVGADGRTFSLTFFARAEEPELRVLREEGAFERAAAAIPGFAPWRAGAQPIGPVGAMGSLQNRLRRFMTGGRPVVLGLIPIGDSLSHTNPTLGRGMSLALDHAFRAARLPWAEGDVEECAVAYHSGVDPMAEASYLDAVDADRVARGLYMGDESIRDEPRAVLTRARPLAAAGDHALYRATVRNNGLLSPPGAFISEPWIGRARALLAAAGPGGAPRPGPARDEMLSLLRLATAR